MLAPGLATMLVVLTTDAVADSAALDTALRAATRVSFDRLDSDGAMSTNDTVLLLASGASGVEPTAELLRRRGDQGVQRPGRSNCWPTPRAPPRRSPSRWCTPPPRTTPSRSAAAVARNNLVKTAFFGQDANWGRILAAVGTVGPHVAFDADAIDVAINGVWICRAGATGDDRDGVDLTGRSVHVDHRPARRHRDGDHPDQRPVARLRARELGVLDMTDTAQSTDGISCNTCRAAPAVRPGGRPGAGRGAGRRAALAAPVRRVDRGGQVRRQRDDRRCAEGRVRRRHGVPAHRRAAARSWCTAAGRRSAPC